MHVCPADEKPAASHVAPARSAEESHAQVLQVRMYHKTEWMTISDKILCIVNVIPMKSACATAVCITCCHGHHTSTNSTPTSTHHRNLIASSSEAKFVFSICMPNRAIDVIRGITIYSFYYKSSLHLCLPPHSISDSIVTRFAVHPDGAVSLLRLGEDTWRLSGHGRLLRPVDFTTFAMC